MFIFIILILVTVGALLVVRGAIGRVEGWEPHCRRCGFCLWGLPRVEPVRCPECEYQMMSLLDFRRGRRRYGFRSLIGGGMLLLLVVVSAGPRFVGPTISAPTAGMLSDGMLADQVGVVLSRQPSEKRGMIAETITRLAAGTLDAAALEQIIDALLEHRDERSGLKIGLCDALADQINAAKMHPSSVGDLADILARRQSARREPVPIRELVNALGGMFMTPGLTTQDRQAVIDFALAYATATATLPSDARLNMPAFGKQLEAALVARAVSPSDFAMIMKAAMTLDVVAQRQGVVAPGETMDLTVQLGGIGIADCAFDYGARVRFRGPHQGWHLYGPMVESPVVRQYELFQYVVESELIRATAPRTPGRYALELEVVITLHDVLVTTSAAATSVPVRDAAPAIVPADVTIRLPAALSVEVAGTPAAAPTFVERDPEPAWVRPRPRRATRYRQPLITTDAASTHVLVTSEFRTDDLAVAYDVWLRHDGVDHRIGWMYAPAGTWTYQEISCALPGLVDGDAVELHYRPAPGRLDRPSRTPEIWGGEVIVPCTVVGVGRLIIVEPAAGGDA